MPRPRVVVLGGGACGMSAAYQLARAGAAVTVLERELRVGGLCGTEEYRGFRFDLGGHRFITRSRSLEALVRDLLGRDLLLRARSSVVLHRGRRYRYPLDLAEVVHGFGLTDGARAVASYAGERLRRAIAPSVEVSFEDWVVHRFGRRLYDAFFGPYTEKLWGLAPSGISSDWAAERISLPSLGDVLVRLAGVRRGGIRTYARRYLYPRLGIGQIFERMATATAALGGSLITGARVVGLALSRGRVAAVRYLAGGQGQERELPCDAVISTLSLPALVRMTGVARSGSQPLLPSVERAVARLRFRGIRLFHLLLDRPQVSPHTWMYVAEPRYLAARIQEPRHRSPDLAPPGRTSLMLEIPCDPGDPIWCAPDEAIYERSLDDLHHLGISGLRAETLGYYSSYVSEGYPIYHLDYRHDRARALAFLDGTEGLVSCGRQGAFRYIFMDTAMEMGMRAADVVLGGVGAPRPGAIAEMGTAAGLIEGRALTA